MMLSRLLGGRAARNLLFVYMLQVSNYVLSFVTVPYLTRVLGVEPFGLLSYCTSVNAYVWMLIDWGYGIGAVRKVATQRGDPEALRAIFWETMIGKLHIAVFALIALVILAFAHGNSEFAVILIASGVMNIIGAILCSDWFVQGVERMGFYLVTAVTARLLGLVLILVMVRNPSDLGAAALIQGLTGLVAGLGGFLIVRKIYASGRPKGSVAAARRELLEFRHFFYARSNALLYITAAPVVLGIVSTAQELGLFAGADKIARIVVTLVGPLSVVMAPRIFAAMAASRETAASMSGMYFRMQLLVTVPAAVLLYIFAGPITQIVLGAHFDEATHLVHLLSPVPVLVGLSGALANQFLVPLGREREMSKVTTASSVIYVICLFALGYRLGATGAAISFIVAECCLIIGYSFVLIRREPGFVRRALSGRGPSTHLATEIRPAGPADRDSGLG